MSIAVVDEGAHLVAFAAMERTTLIGADISQRKAVTAVHFQRDTRDLAPLVRAGQSLFGIEATTGNRFAFFAGGALLRTPDGQVAGGVGFSAGSVEEDHRVAEAGRVAFTTLTGIA